MELPGSGQYHNNKYSRVANKVPQDGGASSSAAFGSFIRNLITLVAGGAAGAAGAAGGAAGGASGAAAGGGAGAAAGGAAPAAGGQFAGVLAGGSSTAPAAASAAAPSMGASFVQGASQGGVRGGLSNMLTNYAGQQPAGSVLGKFGAGASRSGNMLGGLQAQFMDPSGPAVLGSYNAFDLTNMGLTRALGSDDRREWWRR